MKYRIREETPSLFVLKSYSSANLKETGDNHSSTSSSESERENEECKWAIDFWQSRRFNKHPWADQNRPLIRMRHMHDMELDPSEESGILSERILACCLTYLEEAPYDMKYALCKCQLQGKKLRDISAIRRYHYIQYLDLSFNNLTSLNALSEMPYLQYLNVAHNKLEELLDFTPPFFLSYVNYSHNKIKKIPDISRFWSIHHLNLSYNDICEVTSLKNLKYLQHLNLSFNSLTDLGLQTLFVSNNRLSTIGSDDSLVLAKYLKIVDFSNNQITSLRFLRNNFYLEEVIMESNMIEDIMELYHLKDHRNLNILNLCKNKIAEKDYFINACLRTLKHLTSLNYTDITVEMRVQAWTPSKISSFLKVFVTRMQLLMLENIKMSSSGLHLIEYNRLPQRILMIVGPLASSKRYMARKLVENYSDKLVLGMIHSTISKSVSARFQQDFHHVNHEHFLELLKKGKFVAFSELNGHLYGISHAELRKANNMLIAFFCDLQMALTLRITHNVTLVLGLPRNKEMYANWLRRHIFTDAQSELKDMGIQYNYLNSEDYSILYNSFESDESMNLGGYFFVDKSAPSSVLSRSHTKMFSDLSTDTSTTPHERTSEIPSKRLVSFPNSITSSSLGYLDSTIKKIIDTYKLGVNHQQQIDSEIIGKVNHYESNVLTNGTINNNKPLEELFGDKNKITENRDFLQINSEDETNRYWRGRETFLCKTNSEVSSLTVLDEQISSDATEMTNKNINICDNATGTHNFLCSKSTISWTQLKSSDKLENVAGLGILKKDKHYSCPIISYKHISITNPKPNENEEEFENIHYNCQMNHKVPSQKCLNKPVSSQQIKYVKEKDNHDTEDNVEGKISSAVEYHNSMKNHTNQNFKNDPEINEINRNKKVNHKRTSVSINHNSITEPVESLNKFFPRNIRQSVSENSLTDKYQSQLNRSPVFSALGQDNVLEGETGNTVLQEKIESFIKAVMKERNDLFNLHWENPGLFRTVVFTDNQIKSFTILQEIVDDLIEDLSKEDPNKNYFNDQHIILSDIVQHRLKHLRSTFLKECKD